MLRIHSLCVKSPNPTRRTACECDFCQPEVQNLGVAALRHEYVCGLDVPVDDAFCVSCVECVGNLDGKRLNQLRLHRSASNAMLQRQAVEVLHGDERLSMLVVNFVDGANVRMIPCRCPLRF